MRNIELAKKKTSHKVSPKPSEARIPFGMIGVGLIAIIAILVIFIPRIGDRANINELKAIDDRLAFIENRLNRLESVEKRLSSLDEKRTKLEISLMNRIESLEALRSMKSEAKVEKQVNVHSEARPKSTAIERDLGVELKKDSKVQYHEVRAGETLYRISLKYRLPVDELRRLNKIGPEAVIYIGQKLIVSRD